mmetsp:Transcript_26288/g.56736  ORF Transcript_26288/g.56736 Transcript_26288/m.56736 type:complete len:207 (+) Transcript_26288:428-1048(+)
MPPPPPAREASPLCTSDIRCSACALACSRAAILLDALGVGAFFAAGFFLALHPSTKWRSFHSVWRSSALISTSISSLPSPIEGMFALMICTTLPRFCAVSLLMEPESAAFSSKDMSREVSFAGALASGCDVVTNWKASEELLGREPPPFLLELGRCLPGGAGMAAPAVMAAALFCCCSRRVSASICCSSMFCFCIWAIFLSIWVNL